MKAMKALSVNRMIGSVRGRRSPSAQVEATSATNVPPPQNESPEAAAGRSVRLFCESGGPNNSGEEVLYLPTIVEAAESSPAAAKECAQSIKKFLKKDNNSRSYVQYNAIMLMRILTDNPGPTFTRNLDKDFATTLKELLRYGRDLSVKQILMETLESFERDKKEDGNLKILMEMWKKEQEKMSKVYGPQSSTSRSQRASNAPPANADHQNYFSRSHSTNRGLPNPQELASRIEEARTSAKLLTQVVQSTPPAEFLQNDLIKEFADRCQSASRSIQGYIISQNPAPDNDTMQTLIETNDQLALSISKHQRAVLQARRSLGLGSEPSPSPSVEGFVPPPGPPPNSSLDGVQAPPGPPPSNINKPTVPSRKSVPQAAAAAAPPVLQSSTRPAAFPPQVAELPPAEDPFQDPTTATRGGAPAVPRKMPPPEIPVDEFSAMRIEPYHPGFRPSESYVGRQDRAVGNVEMQGGTGASQVGRRVESEDEDEDGGYVPSPVEARKAPVYRY